MVYTQNFSDERKYIPAELKNTKKEWYIEFYSTNPYTAILERHRLRLNREYKRCSSRSEFIFQARLKVQSINNQLANEFLLSQNLQATTQSSYGIGMNPVEQPSQPRSYFPNGFSYQASQATAASSCIADSPSSRFFTPIEEVLDLYVAEKRHELRPSTMRSYAAFANQLERWIKKNAAGLQCYLFTPELAMRFMEYIYIGNNCKGKKNFAHRLEDGHVSARTYNNILKLARAFFSWAKEKCYIARNPFQDLKNKKAHKKLREPIPEVERNRIVNYFHSHQPAMELVMRLVYTSLLRPIEITRIKVEQLNFDEHFVDMPTDQTKTWTARASRMDPDLEALLKEHIKHAKPTDYLFDSSTEAWLPGKTPMNPHSFALAWGRMRKATKLNKVYQLYSLRDSGITDMLHANMNDLDVMQLAGHSSLSVTSRYANHYDHHLIERANTQAPKFLNK